MCMLLITGNSFSFKGLSAIYCTTIWSGENIYFNSGLNQAIVAFIATGNYVIADLNI